MPPSQRLRQHRTPIRPYCEYDAIIDLTNDDDDSNRPKPEIIDLTDEKAPPVFIFPKKFSTSGDDIAFLRLPAPNRDHTEEVIVPNPCHHTGEEQSLCEWLEHGVKEEDQQEDAIEAMDEDKANDDMPPPPPRGKAPRPQTPPQQSIGKKQPRPRLAGIYENKTEDAIEAMDEDKANDDMPPPPPRGKAPRPQTPPNVLGGKEDFAEVSIAYEEMAPEDICSKCHGTFSFQMGNAELSCKECISDFWLKLYKTDFN